MFFSDFFISYLTKNPLPKEPSLGPNLELAALCVLCHTCGEEVSYKTRFWILRAPTISAKPVESASYSYLQFKDGRCVNALGLISLKEKDHACRRSLESTVEDNALFGSEIKYEEYQEASERLAATAAQRSIPLMAWTEECKVAFEKAILNEAIPKGLSSKGFLRL